MCRQQREQIAGAAAMRDKYAAQKQFFDQLITAEAKQDADELGPASADVADIVRTHKQALGDHLRDMRISRRPWPRTAASCRRTHQCHLSITTKTIIGRHAFGGSS
jgi:hypothetical protein